MITIWKVRSKYLLVQIHFRYQGLTKFVLSSQCPWLGYDYSNIFDYHSTDDVQLYSHDMINLICWPMHSTWHSVTKMIITMPLQYQTLTSTCPVILKAWTPFTIAIRLVEEEKRGASNRIRCRGKNTGKRIMASASCYSAPATWLRRAEGDDIVLWAPGVSVC